MKRWKALTIALVVIAASIYGGTAIAYKLTSSDTSEVQTASDAKIARQKEEHRLYELRIAEEQRKAEELTPENLLKYTNEERVKLGLNPVTLNPKLNASAQAKADDMAARNYWDHYTPDGKSPFTFITNQGYSYNIAGENLACGQPSSITTIYDWMNSPKHRANIVKPQYTEVGFGIVTANNYNCGEVPATQQNIIVQHFARPYGT